MHVLQEDKPESNTTRTQSYNQESCLSSSLESLSSEGFMSKGSKNPKTRHTFENNVKGCCRMPRTVTSNQDTISQRDVCACMALSAE